jgi:dihydroorotase
MIDPHVHLRDWNQAHKESLRHGLSLAWRAGLDGVFEMPNTDPPLTSREAILRRLDDADKVLTSLGIPLFHGLYAGLTADPAQVEQVVRAWKDLFPRVVGLKLFAGHSTGGMGIVEKEGQASVYRRLAELGFTGVLAVHCEKESLLKPEAWDPDRPSSHGRARPPAAEVASVDDQVELAKSAGFRGTLHVCHISTPWALDVLRGTHAVGKKEPPVKKPLAVTCGLTPHHALLDVQMMDRPGGILLKMNPPLRPLPLPERMTGRLLAGEIDWVESDHAPHAPAEKLGASAASGIPVLPFWPRFVELLAARGMSPARIDEVTHDAVCRTFGVRITRRRRAPDRDLSKEYGPDPFAGLAGTRSPGTRSP